MGHIGGVRLQEGLAIGKHVGRKGLVVIWLGSTFSAWRGGHLSVPRGSVGA